MRRSVNRQVRGAVIAAVSVIVCALSAGPATARARCHGSVPDFLGFSYYRLDVTVYYHRNMSCREAAQLGVRGYALDGLQVIRDPVFGGGGFGGPFHIGRFSCFLTARGSDFSEAYCASRRQAIFYFDHRETLPA